jgi:hypothetical protein
VVNPYDERIGMTTLAKTPEDSKAALSPIERSKLDELEAHIRDALGKFYDVGSALGEINESRLYREGFDSFEDYLEERWGFSRSYAYRYIEAATVVDMLSPIGDMRPSNEAQCRALAFTCPKLRQEAWRRAVETAPEQGVTARHVASVVRQMKRQRDQELGIGATPDSSTPTIKLHVRNIGRTIGGMGRYGECLKRAVKSQGAKPGAAAERYAKAVAELRAAWKAWKQEINAATQEAEPCN